MSLVFDHEQFTVQIVFTVSSKTVAHRSSAPVRFDRQRRRTACPRHSSQKSEKSSSARNIHRTRLRRNSLSASPIRRPGTATRRASDPSDQRILTRRAPPFGSRTAQTMRSPSISNGDR